MKNDDDPTTWFPVTPGDSKAAPESKAAPSDDPTTWFPVAAPPKARSAAPAPALPPVSEYGDLGNAWWNTKAEPPAGQSPVTVIGGNEPGYVQSNVLPLARRQDVINDPNSHWYQGWAIAPGPFRAIGQTPAENVLINPSTGGMSLSPEALATASMFTPQLRFGGREYVAPGTFDRRPLPPDFNPLSPEAKAAANATPAGPTSPTGAPPPPQPPPPEPKFAGAGAPTGATPTTRTTPTTAAEARAIADQHYAPANNAATSSYTPQSVNRMIDAVDAEVPQGPGAKAVSGDSDVAKLRERLQELRGKPLTLADIQKMDQGMGDKISAAVRAGRNDEATQLGNIQQAWREQADKVTQADVTGGPEGFAALQPARQAWSQYRKMADVEAMQERAAGTQNPTTSFKTAVNNFINGRASRGWSEAEKAALKAAADRGVTGDLMHMLGSRLNDHVGGVIGAGLGLSTFGPVGSFAGWAIGQTASHILGSKARSMGNALQAQRIANVMTVLGKNVPPAPNPLTPPGAP